MDNMDNMDNMKNKEKHVLFVLCGNCRTFTDCFDSFYHHVLTKLFSPNDSHRTQVHIYLYLKLSDPGHKGQNGWNFEYDDLELDTILCTIQKIKSEYSSLHVDYKILLGNEITDEELMSQVKDRNLYNGFYIRDSILLRGLHCHYNFECCGKYILEKEESNQCVFETIIYVRPDLYFTSCSDSIQSYRDDIITLGSGPHS